MLLECYTKERERVTTRRNRAKTPKRPSIYIANVQSTIISTPCTASQYQVTSLHHSTIIYRRRVDFSLALLEMDPYNYSTKILKYCYNVKYTTLKYCRVLTNTTRGLVNAYQQISNIRTIALVLIVENGFEPVACTIGLTRQANRQELAYL